MKSDRFDLNDMYAEFDTSKHKVSRRISPPRENDIDACVTVYNKNIASDAASFIN